MKRPKIIVLDIETAPLKSYHYGLYDQNISVKQICEEWFVLSFCAKELGKEEVTYVDASRTVKKGANGGDTPVLHKLHALLDSADVVITQNGDKFDLKKIRARMLLAGLPPFSPITSIDTLKLARRTFGFTSNGLEWLSKNLTDTPKMTERKFHGFALQMACLAGNPDAWQEMQEYNVRDVIATEGVYNKMLPWVMGHPNLAVYSDLPEHACPKCASTNLVKRGTRTVGAGRYTRYKCLACGAWSRDGVNTLAANVRKALLKE